MQRPDKVRNSKILSLQVLFPERYGERSSGQGGKKYFNFQEWQAGLEDMSTNMQL